MAPGALVLDPKLDARELRALVINVSKTLHLCARVIGLEIPPASEEEADAIAAPAGRMLERHAKVQRIVRKVSDPVILVGAVAAFFAARFFVRRAQTTRTVSAPPPNRDGASAGAGVGAVAASVAPPPPNASNATEQQLRDEILGSIERAGTVL